MTDHFQEWSVGVTKHVVSCMFYFSVVEREECLIMKRSQDESGTCSTIKKRHVDYATFQKWQRYLDREYQTMTWLDYSSEKEQGKKVVVQLKCKVWSDFVEKIRGRKNFSEKWIVGADSVRLSNVRDHAQNDQHTHYFYVASEKETC